MTDLKQFLESRYLHALREYERFTNYKWEDLKIGTDIIVLRSGFSGSGGEWRKIIELHKDDKNPDYDYAVVSGKEPNSKIRCLLYRNASRHYQGTEKEHFTELCYILTDEDKENYEKLRWHDWEKYLYQKTGHIFRA